MEIRILKRLFTPEQAETAVLLSPLQEEAARIAARTGRDEGELASLLNDMADEGLVLRMRRGGRTLFQSTPFMIGLYEYSVRKSEP